MSANAQGYQGTENLEIMEQARNYNSWLGRQLLGHAVPGATVLDFGAGSGTFARRMRDAGYRVTCVEPDDGLRARLLSDGFEAVAGCDSLGARRFDLVYSLNVLEHIHDDHSAVRELADRLAPTGVILIYVPAFQLLYTSMDRKVGHLRRYRWGQLQALAESARLRVSELRYADSLGFLATLCFRFFGPADGTLNVRAIATYDAIVFPISTLLDRLTGRFFGKNLLMVASPGVMQRRE